MNLQVTKHHNRLEATTRDTASAAMCVWEWALNSRDQGHQPLTAMFKSHGLGHMRQAFLDAVPFVQEAWQRAVAAGYTGNFDCQFVPWFMTNCVRYAEPEWLYATYMLPPADAASCREAAPRNAACDTNMFARLLHSPQLQAEAVAAHYCNLAQMALELRKLVGSRVAAAQPAIDRLMGEFVKHHRKDLGIELVWRAPIATARLACDWRELADLCGSELQRAELSPPTILLAPAEKLRYDQAARTYRFCADELSQAVAAQPPSN